MRLKNYISHCTFFSLYRQYWLLQIHGERMGWMQKNWWGCVLRVSHFQLCISTYWYGGTKWRRTGTSNAVSRIYWTLLLVSLYYIPSFSELLKFYRWTYEVHFGVIFTVLIMNVSRAVLVSICNLKCVNALTISLKSFRWGNRRVDEKIWEQNV